jgi:FeS assembly SUF system regulator
VSKVLKKLAHGRVLEAHRGVKGGFSLTRRPEEISVAEIITALEGPVAITQCSTHDEKCDLERQCIVRSNWRKINLVVIDALKRITLADMTHPLTLIPAPVHRVNLQARTL